MKSKVWRSPEKENSSKNKNEQDHPDVPGKLDNLTELMIQKKATTAPKLSCSAGECRGLILFGKLAAERYFSDDVPQDCRIK